MSSLPIHLQANVQANEHLYQPLPSSSSIWIIELEIGRDEMPIKCRLVTVPDFMHAPAFHALRYCWGEELAEETVLCKNQIMRTTQNLFNALNRLRSIGVCRLWADAICINQNNISERNQQVSIMRQIYERAERVHIWLGHSNGNVPLALEVIRRVFNLCCERRYGWETQHLWREKLHNEAARVEVVESAPCQSFQKFLILNYTERPLQTFSNDRGLVVSGSYIQEVQACPEVFMHCAQEQVDWDLVGLTAAWVLYAPSARIIRRMYKYSSYFAQAYFMFRGKLHLRDGVPLLRILDHTRGFKCTEPNDRVFAVLQHPIRHIHDFAKQVQLDATVQHLQRDGMNPNSNHLQIVIDYAKTTFEVYREVVLRSMISCILWRLSAMRRKWPAPASDIRHGCPNGTSFLERLLKTCAVSYTIPVVGELPSVRVRQN